MVAVLYADAPRLDTPSASSRWPAVVDVLARHASRGLEAVTVQQAARLPRPRGLARAEQTTQPRPRVWIRARCVVPSGAPLSPSIKMPSFVESTTSNSTMGKIMAKGERRDSLGCAPVEQ